MDSDHLNFAVKPTQKLAFLSVAFSVRLLNVTDKYAELTGHGDLEVNKQRVPSDGG